MKTKVRQNLTKNGLKYDILSHLVDY